MGPLREGGGKVDVGHDLVPGLTGWHARPPHYQGHPYGLLVGRFLPVGKPVRSQDEAVVRGEKDEGVCEAAVRLELLDNLLDHVVRGKHGYETILVEGIDLHLHLVRKEGQVP